MRRYIINNSYVYKNKNKILKRTKKINYLKIYKLKKYGGYTYE